jgi:hypothetical protein
MAMPEAAMNKDHGPVFWQNDERCQADQEASYSWGRSL